jgi:hypothetical protein
VFARIAMSYTPEELHRMADEVAREYLARKDPTEDIRETVARLAALPPLEYELVREREAANLGFRKSTLDAEIIKARTNARRSGPTAETFERWLLEYCRRAHTCAVTMTEVLNLGPYPLRRKHLVEPVLLELSKLGRVQLKRGPGKTRLVEINADLLASGDRYAAFQ